MIDNNYTVYEVGINKMLFSVSYWQLDQKLKYLIEIAHRAVFEKMKRFIIIYDKSIAIITIRVYSSNQKSRRYVEAVCSYEFLCNFEFEVIQDTILKTIDATIRKTIENMEVAK